MLNRHRALVAILAAGFTTAAAAADAPDFNREVRPILSRYCFKCHGPDDKTRKGGLRLDLRDAALKKAKSGAVAVVPGKPDESELFVRIFSTDKDDVMPPPDTKQEMTAAQKDVLKRWIAAGANYDPHWAFAAPRKGALNSIDAFIDARLAKAGLQRSPEADRSTLIRRVSYDLIGLPPTPEEVTAFETDAAPDAYERLVDRLIASPQYGERWARKWLDLARYADTNGYEKDRERPIWPYRDWVVRALNADMPFDRFTIEQIAGDMLPGATLDQRIATGFHRNTMINEEGGIDPLEFRYHAMADRVATTGATWLGLTTGCAQCHTHKYDPITHREYFGMMAFLDNADEPELDLPPPNAEQQRKDREARAQRLLAELPSKWPADKGSVDAAFTAWLEKERARTVAWTALKPAALKTNLTHLAVQPDLSILGSGDISKSDTYELRFAELPQKITAIRLEALPDASLPAHGPGLCYYEGPKGDFFMGEFQVSADGQPVKFARATESYAKNNFGKKKDTPVSADAATDGDPQTGWSCADRPGEAHAAVFVPAQPISAAQLDVKMLFGRHYACPLGRFRISVTTDPRGAEAREPDLDALLADASVEKLREHFLLTAPELGDAAKQVRELRKPPKWQTTLVLRERPPENPRATFLRNRGEYLQPTDRIEPAVLSMLNPLPAGPRDRLAFARWLVSRDHPLTARVVVNRAWAAFFGKGIVKTTDDFGFQGTPPTHPELLDWLAVEFMERGWSQKKLHRLIVTSATYRQASRVTREQLAKDAENALLSRFPRTRLEAEMIRDGTLRAAGLLSLKMSGAPVRPPQPDGVSEVAYGAPKWNAASGEDRYRRSLYTFIKRTAPFALYNTFDAPTGESCIPRRDVSNTPLQALTLLNDVVFIEAAQALGKTLAATPGDDDAKLHAAFRRVLCRTPRTEELPPLREFVKAQRARFSTDEFGRQGGRNGAERPGEGGAIRGSEPAAGGGGSQAVPDSKLDAQAFAGKNADAETAAWTALARALFNLDEAVTKS